MRHTEGHALGYASSVSHPMRPFIGRSGIRKMAPKPVRQLAWSSLSGELDMLAIQTSVCVSWRGCAKDLKMPKTNTPRAKAT